MLATDRADSRVPLRSLVTLSPVGVIGIGGRAAILALLAGLSSEAYGALPCRDYLRGARLEYYRRRASGHRIPSLPTVTCLMSSITIRNLPESGHAALRRIAAERHVSVEALTRAALSDLATQARRGGIDFRKLARDRAALGLTEDGPAWTDALGVPAFSRRVLGSGQRVRPRPRVK
jgi:plasmid stability protein